MSRARHRQGIDDRLSDPGSMAFVSIREKMGLLVSEDVRSKYRSVPVLNLQESRRQQQPHTG